MDHDQAVVGSECIFAVQPDMESAIFRQAAEQPVVKRQQSMDDPLFPRFRLPEQTAAIKSFPAKPRTRLSILLFSTMIAFLPAVKFSDTLFCRF